MALKNVVVGQPADCSIFWLQWLWGNLGDVQHYVYCNDEMKYFSEVDKVWHMIPLWTPKVNFETCIKTPEVVV